MLITSSEGQGWRYEVIDRAEGFLVIPRDLDTGALDPDEGRLFRFAPVAFAFADLSAAFDRLASARIAGEDTEDLSNELAWEKASYADLCRRLGDEGFAASFLVERSAADKPRLH